jgi:hypothetical protein
MDVMTPMRKTAEAVGGPEALPTTANSSLLAKRFSSPVGEKLFFLSSLLYGSEGLPTVTSLSLCGPDNGRYSPAPRPHRSAIGRHGCLRTGTGGNLCSPRFFPASRREYDRVSSAAHCGLQLVFFPTTVRFTAAEKTSRNQSGEPPASRRGYRGTFRPSTGRATSRSRSRHRSREPHASCCRGSSILPRARPLASQQTWLPWNLQSFHGSGHWPLREPSWQLGAAHWLLWWP